MPYANSGSGGRGRAYWAKETKEAQHPTGDAARHGERRCGALLAIGFLSLAILLVALVLPSGCQQQAATGGRLIFALESEPERLDPLTIKNPQTFRVAWQI